MFGGKITKNSGVSQVTSNHPSYKTTIPDTVKNNAAPGIAFNIGRVLLDDYLICGTVRVNDYVETMLRHVIASAVHVIVTLDGLDCRSVDNDVTDAGGIISGCEHLLFAIFCSGRSCHKGAIDILCLGFQIGQCSRHHLSV